MTPLPPERRMRGRSFRTRKSISGASYPVPRAQCGQKSLFVGRNMAKDGGRHLHTERLQRGIQSTGIVVAGGGGENNLTPCSAFLRDINPSARFQYGLAGQTVPFPGQIAQEFLFRGRWVPGIGPERFRSGFCTCRRFSCRHSPRPRGLPQLLPAPEDWIFRLPPVPFQRVQIQRFSFFL